MDENKNDKIESSTRTQMEICDIKNSILAQFFYSFTFWKNGSPTMVSEYKTQLLGKKLLQQKLHELFENNNTYE